MEPSKRIPLPSFRFLTPLPQEASDPTAHLVCLDGAILKIPPGGTASCNTTRAVDGIEFLVFT